MTAIQEHSDKIQAALQALSAGDQAGAIQNIQTLFGQHGEFPEGLHILGLLALQMGELSRAIELMKAAHQLDPGCKEYAEALAVAFARSGRLNDSLYFGKLAIALKPHPVIKGLVPEWLGRFEESLMNVQDNTYFDDGIKAFRNGDFDQAQENFQKEAELHPEEARAWRMLAQMMRLQNRPVESCMLLKSVLENEKAGPQDQSDLGRSLAMMGKFDQAIQSHFLAGRENPRNPLNLIGKLDALARQPGSSVAEIATAEGWLASSLMEGLACYPDRAIELPAGEKLKVGLLSGRFRAGAGLDFLWPLILHSQKSRIAFFCYSHNPYDDAMTRRIGGAAEDLIDLREVNDRTAAEIIHNDGIDILLDLDGYLESGRPQIVTLKPAPVLMRLSDQGGQGEGLGISAILGGEFALEGSKKGLPIKDGFFSFPEGGGQWQPPKSPGRMIICGWMPEMHRITAHALGQLSALSDAHDNLRILLFVQGCGGVIALDEIEPKLASAGLADKVIFAEPEAEMQQGRLSFLGQCDFLLDLEGDAGMDDALTALQKGLPVISLSGSAPSERMVSDILAGTGLKEMVAEDSSKFIDLVGRMLDPGIRSDMNLKLQTMIERECSSEGIAVRLKNLEHGFLTMVGHG